MDAEALPTSTTPKLAPALDATNCHTDEQDRPNEGPPAMGVTGQEELPHSKQQEPERIQEKQNRARPPFRECP